MILYFLSGNGMLLKAEPLPVQNKAIILYGNFDTVYCLSCKNITAGIIPKILIDNLMLIQNAILPASMPNVSWIIPFGSSDDCNAGINEKSDFWPYSHISPIWLFWLLAGKCKLIIMATSRCSQPFPILLFSCYSNPVLFFFLFPFSFSCVRHTCNHIRNILQYDKFQKTLYHIHDTSYQQPPKLHHVCTDMHSLKAAVVARASSIYILTY